MHVYKLTNKVNGMSYVGATTRPMDVRMADHANAAKQGRTTLIAKAIREFGIVSFEPQILQTINSGSYDDLMAAEIQAIQSHGTFEPAGYNRTTGGLGTPDCRVLESTRMRIGARSIGRKPSAETRLKMSVSRTGKPCPWNQGPRNRPAWNRGLKHTPEELEKMSESHIGSKNANARRIEFNGVEYPCLMDAVRATGFSLMQVRYRLQKGNSARYLSTIKEKTK